MVRLNRLDARYNTSRITTSIVLEMGTNGHTVPPKHIHYWLVFDTHFLTVLSPKLGTEFEIT